MDTRQAQKEISRLRRKSILNKDEEFLYTECLKYMIEETKAYDYMIELGGYYYANKDYELALKYYEMADAYGSPWAAEGLGYIWYYGRTGTKDYEKAFRYYSKAAENGYLLSKIKVADMYKNGYYVEKDYGKYSRIIEESKQFVEHTVNLGDPYPEIYTRLAQIRKSQGKIDEAVSLYLDAKDFLWQRIRVSAFFGDLNIMKWLTEDLYTMIPFDESEFDLYDLFHLLKTPHTVTFMYRGESYTVEAEDTEEGMAVRFEDRWFHNIDDFMNQAVIDNEKLITLYDELYDFEIAE